jgi:hypothetical protein
MVSRLILILFCLFLFIFEERGFQLLTMSMEMDHDNA